MGDRTTTPGTTLTTPGKTALVTTISSRTTTPRASTPLVTTDQDNYPSFCGSVLCVCVWVLFVFVCVYMYVCVCACMRVCVCVCVSFVYKCAFFSPLLLNAFNFKLHLTIMRSIMEETVP